MKEKRESCLAVHHQVGDKVGNYTYWERFNQSFRRLSREGYRWEDRVDLFEYYLGHEYN